MHTVIISKTSGGSIKPQEGASNLRREHQTSGGSIKPLGGTTYHCHSTHTHTATPSSVRRTKGSTRPKSEQTRRQRDANDYTFLAGGSPSPPDALDLPLNEATPPCSGPTFTSLLETSPVNETAPVTQKQHNMYHTASHVFA